MADDSPFHEEDIAWPDNRRQRDVFQDGDDDEEDSDRARRAKKRRRRQDQASEKGGGQTGSEGEELFDSIVEIQGLFMGLEDDGEGH